MDASDLLFIVRSTGSIEAAITYCRKIAAMNGPLSNTYADAADRISRITPR